MNGVMKGNKVNRKVKTRKELIDELNVLIEATFPRPEPGNGNLVDYTLKNTLKLSYVPLASPENFTLSSDSDCKTSDLIQRATSLRVQVIDKNIADEARKLSTHMYTHSDILEWRNDQSSKCVKLEKAYDQAIKEMKLIERFEENSSEQKYLALRTDALALADKYKNARSSLQWHDPKRDLFLKQFARDVNQIDISRENESAKYEALKKLLIDGLNEVERDHTQESQTGITSFFRSMFGNNGDKDKSNQPKSPSTLAQCIMDILRNNRIDPGAYQEPQQQQRVAVDEKVDSPRQPLLGSPGLK